MLQKSKYKIKKYAQMYYHQEVDKEHALYNGKNKTRTVKRVARVCYRNLLEEKKKRPKKENISIHKYV